MKTAPALLLLALAAATLLGCRRDELITDDPGARLTLTEDTIFFDTVFTTVGSVTKRFVVRNENDGAVHVDVALEGGSPSPYRINVDGASGTSFNDVEILGHDSIFVFVEATIDGGNANNPFLIEDHILFTTNGNAQRVLLMAYGQNAHFYRPDQHVQGLPAFSYIAGGYDENGQQICETVHWTNDKPYVIFGYGVVDSCCTLIIDPGVRVYMHGGAGLWVYKYGRIQANGTVQERITFQQDRRESIYDDLPNQWDRIWINEGDQDNEFSNCVIKNALIGIQAQSLFTSDQPVGPNHLVLNNVIIQNCATAGLYTENYRVNATNLLLADAGQYCAVLTGGGQYRFDHCTLANYWSLEVRQDPAFLLTDKFVNISGGGEVRTIETSSFKNGIIYGNNTNEFKLEVDGGAGADFAFDHFLFKTDQSTDNGSGHFPDQGSIFRNQEPGFVDPEEHDLHISTGAFCKDKGVPSADVTNDLDNVPYGGDGQYPLGCYQHN